jgi:hypothetical protein
MNTIDKLVMEYSDKMLDINNAEDMLTEIKNWVEYMQIELDKERIDLYEISEIEQVYEITRGRA